MMHFQGLAPGAYTHLTQTAQQTPRFSGLLNSVANTTPGQDPKFAREMFIRDLDRQVQRGVWGDAERDVNRASERERFRMELTSGRYGYGYLQPGKLGKQWVDHRMPRVKPEHEYMLRAFDRDQALAGYDRAMREDQIARARRS